MHLPVVILTVVLVVAGASLAHAESILLEDILLEATGPFTPIEAAMLTPPDMPGNDYKIIDNAPSNLSVGSTIITWVVLYNNGDHAVYEQQVTVRDTTPPKFTSDIPSHIEVFSKSGKKVSVQFDLPEASDIADIDVDVTSTHKPGSKFPVGNMTVTFTARDDSGNTVTHDMIIIVRDWRVQNLVLERTQDRIRATWDQLRDHTSYQVILRDHDTQEKLQEIRKDATTHTFAGLEQGTKYAVSVGATGDRSTTMKKSTTTLEVVIPVTPLHITAPEDVTLEAAAPMTPVYIGIAGIPPEWEDLAIVSNDAPEAFPVGTTTITWRVTHDDHADTDVQDVTVLDTTPPVFGDVPDYAKFESPTGKKIAVEFELPGATDIADPDVTVTSSHPSGHKFDIGSTIVTFEAVDDSGNTAEQEVTVIIVDTHPKIQNIELDVRHDGVDVSWDPMSGHTSYKVALKDSDGKVVSRHTVSSTSHTFSGLDPGSKYEITVQAHDNAFTKSAIGFTTIPIIIISDDFSDLDGWKFMQVSYPGTWRGVTDHDPSTYQPAIDATTGVPAPSAKMSGDGYIARPYIYKTVDLDQFGGDDIFIGIDYRATSRSTHSSVTNAFITIVDSDGIYLLDRWMARGGVLDSGWRSFSYDVTDIFKKQDSVTVRLGVHDVWGGNFNQAAFFDNFHLGNVPPTPRELFTGGSAEEHDDAQKIIDQILAGNTDPYLYEDGVRVPGSYNDLVADLLLMYNVTRPGS